MKTPRTMLRFVLVLALLLFGLPVSATNDVVPVPPVNSAGGAAAPIWLSNGQDMPAPPQNRASGKAPEGYVTGGLLGAIVVDDLEYPAIQAARVATPGAPTPLYLCHCAFLC